MSTESLPPVAATNHHDIASNLGSSYAELHEVLLKSKPQPLMAAGSKHSLTPEKNILINRLAYRLLNKRNGTDHSGSRVDTQSMGSKGGPLSYRSALPSVARSRINQIKEDHKSNVRSILDKCSSAKKPKPSEPLTNPLLNKDIVEHTLHRKEIILHSPDGARELAHHE